MQFLEWLQATAWGVAVRESLWLYPIFETLHLVGLALLFGSIAMIDLRLLGLSRGLPVTLTARHVLPWSWAGFALAAFSGLSLFSAYAVDYFFNFALRVKLILIAIAGVNAAMFHWRVFRRVESWNQAAASPMSVRAFATLSILLWASVIAAGRMIAYTGGD